jgi:hypothetical protein
MDTQRKLLGGGHGRRKVTTRAGLLALSVAIAGLAAPAGAPAQEPGSRQTAELSFTATRPARPSGLVFTVDYVNPADPAAKPHSVQRVVQQLAQGSRIDTSVPPRCAASDAELILRGAEACPSARVGGGLVDLDTGAPGPLRIINTEVTLLNADGQIILLFQETNTPARSRTPVRATVSGRTVDTDPPPLPGLPPPDPFLAVKTVRLTVDRISRVRGGRRVGYVTTPRTCPRTRRWTNRTTFSYPDEVSQTVATASPCVRAAQRRRSPRFTG